MFEVPPQARTGRGATVNVPGRFEARWTDPDDDGWGEDGAPPPAVPTTVTPEATRSVLTFNDSPDVGFDRSVNPYRGCEHGCTYCFARPSHAFLGLSPGLDFETRIFSKPEAPRLLRGELARPGYCAATVILGANTDPYQPAERELRITRGILEVLLEARHPVSILTKAARILRDLDLLEALAAEGLVHANLSVTTLDAGLCRRMEPRASAPHRRLEAVAALASRGIPTGVMVAPVIPGLTDHEVESILEAAAAAGAGWAGWVLLRLPHELKEVFPAWLAESEPTRAGKVLSRLREMRGGELYDSRFGVRGRGTGRHAELLARRFDLARRRLGLDRPLPDLDASRFRPPARGGQARLF